MGERDGPGANPNPKSSKKRRLDGAEGAAQPAAPKSGKNAKFFELIGQQGCVNCFKFKLGISDENESKSSVIPYCFGCLRNPN
jgi:hypothetical protein